MLLIDVFELGVPQADLGAFFIEAVITASKVEAVRGKCAFAVERHLFHARIVARAVGAELATIEVQPGDFLGGDLATTEGLWQGAAIVRAQDWQYRHPLADFKFRIGDFGLGRNPQTTKVIGGLAVAVGRQQLSAGRALATVEFLRVQPQHIHPEAHRTLGKAGLDVENEVLRPLFGLALRVVGVGVVAVDIGVAQGQRGFGVVDETFGQARQRQRQAHAAKSEQHQRAGALCGF